MTFTEKLQKIANIKSDIKTALLNKEAITSETKFEDYAQAISDFQGGDPTAEEANIILQGIVGEEMPSFDKLVDDLENYEITKDTLPAPGSLLNESYADIKYSIYNNGNYVNTDWVVLGYNASIPEYVKYKSDAGERIYVKTTKNGLLASITAGDKVYLRNSAGDYFGDTRTLTLVSGTFTYGNNCMYNVPTNVVINNTSYKFAGYNVTIQSKLCLNINSSTSKMFNGVYKYDETTWLSYYCNKYSESEIRRFLNTDNDSIYKRLMPEFSTKIIPIVNRTFVSDYSYLRKGAIMDSNYCEHVVDKMWLLGVGNVNCKGSTANSWYKDHNYDTSYFGDVYTRNDTGYSNNNTSRLKYYMTTSGGKSSSACSWWLRSANTNRDNGVASVHSDGYVDHSLVGSNYGVAPACTIG